MMAKVKWWCFMLGFIAFSPTYAAVQGQYDVAYSICQSVAPVGGLDYPIANMITPTAASANYFQNKGIHLEPSDSLKVTLIVPPKYGKLQSKDGYTYGVFLYNPNTDYLGSDSMIFSVEVKGKVFKVIYSVDVVEAPDSGSPSCPTGNGIKELPTPARSP